MTITADMTFGEIALLPEFAGFGEHLMLCRPSTWERMWNKPIAAHLNSDTNPYEVTRVLRGLNRIVELADDGRQVAYDIWDEADCIRDPTRRNAKLFFFPGRPGAPFVIAISGGGYQSVCHQMEGFPVAPELNDAGYNVFVLSYRVRVEPLMPRPIDDLNRAVRFVLENSTRFNVDKKYAVIGFSAGAHLTAEWGTDNKGFASYGCEPPKALVLCYAPIDLHESECASDHRFLDWCAVELGTMRLMISALINMCGNGIRRHIFGNAPTMMSYRPAISERWLTHWMRLGCTTRRLCIQKEDMR